MHQYSDNMLQQVEIGGGGAVVVVVVLFCFFSKMRSEH